MDDVAVPGKLKLKKGGINKKQRPTEATINNKSLQKAVADATTKPRKTKAEVAFEERQQKLLTNKVLKMAEKSHKERVAEFNAKLESLPEINDIPKVSWTK